MHFPSFKILRVEVSKSYLKLLANPNPYTFINQNLSSGNAIRLNWPNNDIFKNYGKLDE